MKNDDEVVSLNNGDALYLRDVQQEKGIKRPGADTRCKLQSWRCGKEGRRKESAKPKHPPRLVEITPDLSALYCLLITYSVLRPCKYALF
jgi:endonuclease YncB( thermonuclease family)